MLVIIGLIVGGILTGYDLINAAKARATVSQIEKYQTAVLTFRTKYNCLPGDCANAADFGFIARGTNPGEGDGDGMIFGIPSDGGTALGIFACSGEAAVFWVDLSMANLISDHFNTASETVVPSLNTPDAISNYLPSAALGGGNNIYVYSTDFSTNYFGISAVTQVGYEMGGGIHSNPAIPVEIAYNIDTKMDDGLPQSGGVRAQYNNIIVPDLGAIWASGGGVQGASGPSPTFGPTTAATPRTAITCYDNGGNDGTVQQYSVANGMLTNCGLTIKFP